MKSLFSLTIIMCMLSACNSVYVKPETLDTNKTFYAPRGGYTMRRAVKEQLESRGYNVIVGKAKETRDMGNNLELERDEVVNADYVVHVNEHSDTFRPFWCFFNGIWWWNFSLSIANQQTGDELLTWRGRGCANSSIRKLNNILDQMEKH